MSQSVSDTITDQVLVSSDLPTASGLFRLWAYKDGTNPDIVALSMGDITTDAPVLARVHSECLTGDAFLSRRCDCGPQLRAAMRLIAKEGRGVIIYLKQEGRGIGIFEKVRAYHLQDQGVDTYEANLILGHGADERTYHQAAKMCQALKVKSLILMTNNPQKVEALESMGLKIHHRQAHKFGHTRENAVYRATKKRKFGHYL